jgi:hypothetical protein
MSSFSFLNATTYVAGYDFTTDTNQASINVEVEELDATTFGGNGTRSRRAGLRTITSELGGFWQSATSGAVDPEVFPDLGVADRVLTMSPTGVAGDPVYMYQAGKFGYQAFGTVGELTPFSLNCSSTNGVGVVRGQLAKARGDVSATGALGSALNLGAVGTGQNLYAALHVFGTPGTTITVRVQSATSSAFTSPTNHPNIGGGAITAAGGYWMARIAGPITNTWYRFDVSAITGTFNVAGAIAVQ